MKTATDHAIRAKLLLEAGRDFDIRKAHVHATLALAAEQHTANLIAYLHRWTDDEILEVDAQIRERLGLS
jgi:hypothetical protein